MGYVVTMKVARQCLNLRGQRSKKTGHIICLFYCENSIERDNRLASSLVCISPHQLSCLKLSWYFRFTTSMILLYLNLHFIGCFRNQLDVSVCVLKMHERSIKKHVTA